MAANINAGVVGLVHGHNAIAKIIQFWMRIYSKKKKVYSHGFIIIEFEGQIYVAEAIRKGVTISLFEKEYGGKKNYILFEPKVPWTPDEIKKLSHAAIESSFNVTRYSFGDITFQILLIITGKWFGPTGNRAEKRMYCSEAVATWINKVRPGFFINPPATNPMDIYNNGHLQQIL
jgi:hypothetical protein